MNKTLWDIAGLAGAFYVYQNNSLPVAGETEDGKRNRQIIQYLAVGAGLWMASRIYKRG